MLAAAAESRPRRRPGLHRGLLACLVAVGLSFDPGLEATEVKIFLTQSQAGFLKGELESITVDPLGVLRLAHRTDQVATIEEPFLLSASELPDGWVVGTGNAGRVLKIHRDGEVELLFEAEEPEIFTVWADAEGVVYAGSSPHGSIYRHAGGETTKIFDPEQTYIWSLKGDGHGNLLAATGTEGKLFRVSPEGEGELLYDSDDTHLRSMAVLDEGIALVGTAGEGLVLHIAGDGKARTLYDAAAPEIVAFTTDPQGGAWFAALASEASFVDLDSRNRSRQKNENGKKDEEENGNTGAEVDIEASVKAPAAGSRPSSFSGARSEIFHWTAEGGVVSAWQFKEETVFALLWDDERLWVATGLEGKLYSYQNEQMVLEKDLDESQIVGLSHGESGPAFATTNAAALYRFESGTESKGTLTSTVSDALLTSTFGTLRWRGKAPQGTQARFSFRGGLSATPDNTWTDWTAPKEGEEISLRDQEPSRYLQWRVELLGTKDRTPEVRGVEISYLQANQKPQIEQLEVLGPGQILVPNNFNPSSQIFEPAHPNRDGIFTALGAGPAREGRGLKALWKRGYRTLRWRCVDPNKDQLSYSLTFRPEDDPEGWLSMAEDLTEVHYSFDATVLPDGQYRFRIKASDAPSNLERNRLDASKTSELVVIDHSPPTLGLIASAGTGRLRIAVADVLSILREAVISIDAGPWEEAKAVDNLLDARNETLLIEVDEDASLLLLRLTDAAFNIVTYDLSEHLP